MRGARVFRFGEFELHVRSGELRRGGEPVRLQEQPYRILLMLLEHPGEVVLREEIRKRLWPNDTVVEISHGINAAVLRLREALGESADDPRYVETVARRGYRFRGVVDMSGQIPAAAPSGADTGELTGKTLSHFRILDRLGMGGMGVVYRAEDLKLGREVALKFLPSELAGEPVALRRFEREARTASVLNHPNICTVYSVEDCGGQAAIVMELLKGQTLEARLKAGPMSMAEALTVAIPIAAAMEAAHHKGIVHRDLKPANVVITENGVKVADFGLAKTVRTGEATERPDLWGVASGQTQSACPTTMDGAIVGTPDYMAPEQALGLEVGAAGDIYSFGVMLREMLAGPAMTPALERVVQRCLAREPENRWHSAGDLKAALEMAVAGPKFHLPRVNPWIAAGIATCASLLAANLYWHPLSHEPPRLTISTPGSLPARLSVSPDGGRVAYSSGGRLWLRALGDAESRLIEASEGAGGPFWSPDGKYLAFAAGGKLRKIRADGGMPQTLCNVNTNLAGSWGPNGDILIGQIGDGIFRISASGGEPERITRPDSTKNETRHMLPQFLPGGRRFLYVAGGDKPGYSALWAADLNGGDRKALMSVESTVTLVTPARGTEGYLLFLRDRALMAQGLDVYSLELIGSARMLAAAVSSVPSQGSAAIIGDFSAAGKTLVYRAASPSLGARMISTQPVLKPAEEIIVLRNWM
jgi:serine/threonine protein kinase/DNA-binding winged helix-turn-helix (wHTH) protein